MIKEPYVHTVWCDDIRMEVGNKPSFMGIFTGALLVPTLPVVLPKLGVQTWICTPIGRRTKKMSLELIRDDGLVVATLIPDDTTMPEDPTAADSTRQSIVVSLMVGPLEIPAGCKWFMTRVTLDDEQIDGPKLRIQSNAEQFSQLMQGAIVPAIAVATGGAG